MFVTVSWGGSGTIYGWLWKKIRLTQKARQKNYLESKKVQKVIMLAKLAWSKLGCEFSVNYSTWMLWFTLYACLYYINWVLCIKPNLARSTTSTVMRCSIYRRWYSATATATLSSALWNIHPAGLSFVITAMQRTTQEKLWWFQLGNSKERFPVLQSSFPTFYGLFW